MKIKCPFYEEIKVRYCRAFEKRILVPRGTEKEKYCTCRDYVNCPVFLEHCSKKFKGKIKAEDIEVVDD